MSKQLNRREINYDINEYLNNYNTLNNKRLIEEFENIDNCAEQKKDQIDSLVESSIKSDLHMKNKGNKFNDNSFFSSRDNSTMTFDFGDNPKFFATNEYIYFGYIKNNQRNGIGVLYNKIKKYFYKGYFRKDQFDYGIISIDKGISKYEGYWSNNFQHGIGIEIYNQDTVYKGEFSNGQKDGLGVFIWPNGARYEGEWRRNNMDGFGIYYYANKSFYKGQFKENFMEGYGEFDWNDDKYYIGNYKNDKRFGCGILFFNKNKVYIGTWLNGNMHGFGRIISKGKENKFGYWSDGKLVLTYNKIDEAIKENIYLQNKKELLQFIMTNEIKIFNLYSLKNKYKRD